MKAPGAVFAATPGKHDFLHFEHSAISNQHSTREAAWCLNQHRRQPGCEKTIQSET
jgi:hypothetical protein